MRRLAQWHSPEFPVDQGGQRPGPFAENPHEVSSYDALCLMVQAGVGIGIMPQGSVGIYNLSRTRMVGLDETWACRELSVCVRSREAFVGRGGTVSRAPDRGTLTVSAPRRGLLVRAGALEQALATFGQVKHVQLLAAFS